MLSILIKLLGKSTGLVAAFLFACNHLELEKIHGIVAAISNEGSNSISASTEIIFAFLCITVVCVGYYVISDLTKTISDSIYHLNKYRNERKKSELVNEVLTVIQNSPNTNTNTNRTDHIPFKPDCIERKNSIDPMREVNEAMRGRP